MIAVIFGFLGLFLSSILILLVLNYSVYLWESDKINDLTSRIKTDGEDHIPDFLAKNNASRGFTTRDLNENISRNRSISAIKHEDRKVIFVDGEEQSAFLNSVIVFFKKFQVNFWAQIRSIYRYLIHLAKPNENITDTSENEHEKVQITEVIQKVKDADQDEIEEDENQINQNQVVVVNPKKTATSDDTDDDEEAKEQKDLELFEKMENKLLAKLKEVGMKHFDLWLDLGKLYEKYDYNEKATEVYSMILKHADGKEKEFAKDRLIEMN